LQERPDVAYHLVAVDFLPPAVIQASLARLAAEFASGELYFETCAYHCARIIAGMRMADDVDGAPA
jgi:hypothetical protein